MKTRVPLHGWLQVPAHSSLFWGAVQGDRGHTPSLCFGVVRLGAPTSALPRACRAAVHGRLQASWPGSTEYWARFGAWRGGGGGRAHWFPSRRWAGWVQVPAAPALRTQPVESARLDGLLHQEPVRTQPRAGGLRVLGWYLVQHLQLRQEAPHRGTVVVLGGFLQRWAAVGGARWPSSDPARGGA